MPFLWQLIHVFIGILTEYRAITTMADLETVRVGVVRDSMLKDPLLIKPLLGKTKSLGLTYPGPDFVYGKVTTARDGGVAAAISNWRTPPVPSASSIMRRKTERDFVALNREAVKSGMVTAKEVNQYCATHDIRRSTTSKYAHRPPLQIPQDATFGISVQSSTPVSELLQYKYAMEWIEEQQARDRARIAQQPKKLKGIPDTRTTLLRKSRPLEKDLTLWKMPRFEQVGPALDTFRSAEARMRAMSTHQSEAVARRGQLGQGTYTVD